mmetsp:Transcript_36028/g.36713  ORF Transcript_36028/g.36713 Transcript_36028/m.36713 type:complete len:212 (+) Transcript_36028:111-746(+)
MDHFDFDFHVVSDTDDKQPDVLQKWGTSELFSESIPEPKHNPEVLEEENAHEGSQPIPAVNHHHVMSTKRSCGVLYGNSKPAENIDDSNEGMKSPVILPTKPMKQSSPVLHSTLLSFTNIHNESFYQGDNIWFRRRMGGFPEEGTIVSLHKRPDTEGGNIVRIRYCDKVYNSDTFDEVHHIDNISHEIDHLGGIKTNKKRLRSLPDIHYSK